MIHIDEKNRITRSRSGESKTVPVGKILHNPDRKGGHKENRLPFIYIGGVCLTASDCKQISELLENFGD
jgi:hypothetical protein